MAKKQLRAILQPTPLSFIMTGPIQLCLDPKESFHSLAKRLRDVSIMSTPQTNKM
jgi:hypothetical protein